VQFARQHSLIYDAPCEVPNTRYTTPSILGVLTLNLQGIGCQVFEKQGGRLTSEADRLG
jgi:hypothetical protein